MFLRRAVAENSGRFVRWVNMAEFEDKLRAAWPPDDWRDVTILVAVSGGADSVALLRGLIAIASNEAGQIVAGHLNHRLRGSESDEDATFVRNLSEQLNIRCEVGTADIELTHTGGEGLESIARQSRYEFLKNTANAIGARFVVTAHTADDQAETVLHRIVRGTGLSGLAGVPEKRLLTHSVTLVRPMLNIWRAEVTEYLDSLGQSFRLDSSNADLSFTRNRIRHQLMPLLAEEYNERVQEALLRLATLAGQTQSAIETWVADLFDRVVQIRDSQVVIVPGDRDTPRHLSRELFKTIWRRMQWPEQSMSFEHWDQLADLCEASIDQAKTLPGSIRAEKKGGQLTLTHP